METHWIVNLCLYLLLADCQGTFGQDMCSQESIQRFRVVQKLVGKVTLGWQVASSTNASYVVDYSSLSSSDVKMETLPGDSNLSNGNVTFELDNLLSFTTYNISVLIMCRNNMNQLVQGPPSSMLVQTIASKPSGIVKNVSFVNVSSSGNLRLINISWVPLEEQLWNGVPYIYIVYLTRPDETVVTHFVHFPHSNILISLQAGVYGVQVEAVNEVGLAGKTTDLVSLDLTASSGLSVADYPYFYIIIPGLVFLAVIIAIPIFIFRKIHENKMRSISYVRDIEDKTNLGGFGNMVPMRELSPQSPNTGTIPVSSATNSSFPSMLHPHIQLANRPLPLSPMLPLMPVEDGASFNVAASTSTHVLSSSTSNSSLGAMSYKKSIATHPGPLPMLEENVEHTGRFHPISRTMTEQSFGSVFSPISMTAVSLSSMSPPSQLQQHPSQYQQQHSSQQASHQQASHQQASHQQPSHQQASHQQVSHQQVSHQQASHQQASHQQASHQQASHQQASHQQASNQQASNQQRGRSNTMGGIPSPYEVPDTNNGVILPHEIQNRPSSAHSNQQRTTTATGCDMGGSFPPPPAHSPPGLTQSSGDVHMRVMNEHPHHHHVGGTSGGTGYHHTNPHPHHNSKPDGNMNSRMNNQRSFSASTSHGHVVNDPRLLSSMRSDGHIPAPTEPEDDGMSYTQSSNGAENTVYIHPPLDSDLELQSTSSCSGYPHDNDAIGQRPGLDLGQPLHPHQPSHHGHQPHYPGINGSMVSPEPFNIEGSVSHKPMPHYPPPSMREREQERGRDASKRESLYSETSTELSITSGSDKETSPCGWDLEHKVSRSDVGVSRHLHTQHHHHRHHRSSTPPERETFSDLGIHGNNVRFHQNGFV